MEPLLIVCILTFLQIQIRVIEEKGGVPIFFIPIPLQQGLIIIIIIVEVEGSRVSDLVQEPPCVRDTCSNVLFLCNKPDLLSLGMGEVRVRVVLLLRLLSLRQLPYLLFPPFNFNVVLVFMALTAPPSSGTKNFSCLSS